MNIKTAIITITASFSMTTFSCSDFQGLEYKMMKSGASAKELLVTTMNRLGYGIHSRNWLNTKSITDIEKKYGRRVAISIIANEIRTGFRQLANPGYFPYVNQAIKTVIKNNKGVETNTTLSPYLPLNQLQASQQGLIKDLGLEKGRKSRVTSEFRGVQIRRKIMDSINHTGLNVSGKISHIWYNHLNVDAKKSKLTTAHYERQIKRKSCGTFFNMLKMSAHHPAMLRYLDNIKNTRKKGNKKGINENYGREIVELHTLASGPIRYDKNGNKKIIYYVGDMHEYDEVLESAKVFTGWGVNFKTRTFVFNENLHEPGKKFFPKMFGKKVSIAEGYKGGLQFLKLLSNHRRTKRNVCRKLLKGVYGFHPGQDEVTKCVKAYGKDGKFSSMYKAMIVSDTFWDKSKFGAGIKTPFESIISTARALGHFMKPVNSKKDDYVYIRIARNSSNLGFPLFTYPAPTGIDITRSVQASPVYTANRYDVYNSLFPEQNNLYTFTKAGKKYRFKGYRLENYVIKQNKTTANKAKFINTIMNNIAPVFSNAQKFRLKETLTKHFSKMDREGRSQHVPVKSTIIRALASGPSLRK